jgi:hypothetical protein
MTSPQKAKGGAWEREVATYMSKLYESSFVRAAHSGAYIGGTNNHRTETLSTNQVRSFKGDIIPPDTWTTFNAEAKSYKDFPFHQLPTGKCSVFDSWVKQLMDVAAEGDMNILFMKFTRKGKFVAVESKYTWVADNFIHYNSETHGEWIIMDFDHFFKLNKELIKSYSGSTGTRQ